MVSYCTRLAPRAITSPYFASLIIFHKPRGEPLNNSSYTNGRKNWFTFHVIFLDNPPKNFFQNGWTPLTYTFLERSWPKLSLDGVYYDVISKWRPLAAKNRFFFYEHSLNRVSKWNFVYILCFLKGYAFEIYRLRIIDSTLAAKYGTNFAKMFHISSIFDR